MVGKLRFRFAAAALALCALAPRSASAQQATFELDRGEPPGGPDDTLALARPVTAASTRLFAHVAYGFALRPLRARTVATDSLTSQQLADPVKWQLTGYANVGADLFDRLTLMLGLPATLGAKGSEPLVANVGNGVALQPFAVHDLRMEARAVALRSDSRASALSLIGRLYLPSGDQYSYASDGTATGYVGVAAETELRPFVVVADVGVRFRPQNSLGAVATGDELDFAAGFVLPMREGRVRTGFAVRGATPLSLPAGNAVGSPSKSSSTPLEWIGDLSVALGARRDLWLSFGGGTRLDDAAGAADVRAIVALGGAWVPEQHETRGSTRQASAKGKQRIAGDRDGDGIPDADDLCPSVPEDGLAPDPSDGCPKAPDRDGDGLADLDDKCPDQPEDFDGLDDADGCPDDDVDLDGIPDREDACPRVAGARSPDPKRNGCKGGDVVAPELAILEVVSFEAGESRLSPQAQRVLDEVAREILDSKEARTIVVEGHCDAGEPEFRAQALSEQRAQEVATWLVSRGVARDRLGTVGRGASKPISRDDTELGRRKNRRVEFVVK